MSFFSNLIDLGQSVYNATQVPKDDSTASKAKQLGAVTKIAVCVFKTYVDSINPRTERHSKTLKNISQKTDIVKKFL